MSTVTPDLIRNCRRCSSDLAPDALVCANCHALVHSERLDQLASEAKALEAKRDFRQARERWLMGLPLLPRNSRQADWIVSHARSLDALADQIQPPPSENKWAQKLGPVGPLAIILAKGKFLLGTIFKLKFLLSFVAFFGFYWAAFGMKFGIGFAVLILIHEMGHYIDITRRGLPADMPVFLPGFGAYVRWQGLGVPIETQAAISLAGPLAGFLASVACAAIWYQTHDPLWAALARSGAWLNILNLIPIWMLDGGHAALALSKVERIVLLTASLALWWALGENLFLLVAIGAGYQAFFAGHLPARPSHATTAYFIAVLTALGLIMRLLPGQGFGTN
ncbi:MAG TPA: site-2 protease family protein [Candidatus Dormibacteraeota bacterium]|nr:site-2 protease family protein [Candidatus Dormibacteraeota bacterium]